MFEVVCSLGLVGVFVIINHTCLWRTITNDLQVFPAGVCIHFTQNECDMRKMLKIGTLNGPLHSLA